MIYIAVLLQRNGEIIHGYLATKLGGSTAQLK
jgi:hypothetical protein